MNDKQLAAYRAQIWAELQKDLAKAPTSDPFRGVKMKFLLDIADTRLRKHLSQAELAQKCGLQRTQITKAESMRGNPTLSTL